MAIMDSSCLYSTIKNISGAKQTMSWLPPHGRELDADEELTVFGHIHEAIIPRNRASSQRQIDSLVYAIKNGLLEIVETPAPIVYDAHVSVDAPRMLQISNGTITSVAPCWESSI